MSSVIGTEGFSFVGDDGLDLVVGEAAFPGGHAAEAVDDDGAVVVGVGVALDDGAISELGPCRLRDW